MSASPHLEAERIHLLEAATRGPVLDLACGSGRNACPAANWGARVVGIDRSAERLDALRSAARAEGLPLLPVRADLESQRQIPVRSGSCGAILVFRFLSRPLAPAIVDALAPGGLLLYETFTFHQKKLGYGPENPAFLLEDGELPTLFPELKILAHWEGVEERGAKPEAVARLTARKT
ncbi:MAG: class I SAM-dependent methyltransferase [bacterium]|nr:class I SAM-dependent methyltransferase [bacterium]